MRIILSATPQHGHLLPLLPLARAFRARGHEVAVLTSGGLGPVIESEGFRLLAAGPLPDVIFAEVEARTGLDPLVNPSPEAGAEFFAGARVDLTADEALEAAREFGPDLVVREICDYVGPLVAAAQQVPLATLAFGPALPREFLAAFDARAAHGYAARGLALPRSAWHLDPCPPSLQFPGWQPPEGWQPVRPEPHRRPGATAPAAERSTRQRVLVSYGTAFNNPEVVSPLLRQLSALDTDIVATLGLFADPAQFDVDRGRITFVPFTPLAELLPGVDAILTHGGAGTTLGALSAGIPLVITPQGADQFIQAECVTVAGAGIALQSGEVTPEAVSKAVHMVLTEVSYRKAAAAIAEEIAAMPDPSEVAAALESAWGRHAATI